LGAHAPVSLSRREFLSLGQVIVASPLIASLGCSRTSFESAKQTGAVARGPGFEALERRIQQSMTTLNVPGVSIAIIRDARIAWQRGFGVRDRSTGVPVDEDTVFSAQSMSKPVFAYRVMKLCEQGVLDLDAPLTRYTPDVFVKNDSRLNEITPRRVLSTRRDCRTGGQRRIHFGSISRRDQSGRIRERAITIFNRW